MTRVRLGGALFLLVVLIGCRSGPESAACSKAGCSDGMTYVLSDTVTQHWPRPVTIVTCIDSHCATEVAQPGDDVNRWLTKVWLEPGTLDRDVAHTASIVVVDQHGLALFDRTDPVMLNTTAPNGIRCGPVCGQTGIEITVES